MKESLLNHLCCTFCYEDFYLEILQTNPHDSTEIEEGFLSCKKCGRKYCITNGIARILTPGFFHLFDSAQFKDKYPTEFESVIDSHKSPCDNYLGNVNWNTEEINFWDEKYKRDQENEKIKYQFNVKKAPLTQRSWQNRLVPRERVIFRHIRDKIQSQSYVLEVGCGKAITVSNLLNPKDLNFSYVGMDLSSPALELSKKFVLGDFIQCPTESIPFKSESADVLLSFGCLEHIPGHEMNIPILLDKIKKGGYFAIQESLGRPKFLTRFLPFLKNLMPGDSPHEESIDLENTLKYLEDFEIIDIEFEASPIQTWMMYLFGPVASRSANVFRIIELIDKAAIKTLGRLFPIFDKGIVILLAKKFMG